MESWTSWRFLQAVVIDAPTEDIIAADHPPQETGILAADALRTISGYSARSPLPFTSRRGR